MINGTDMSTPVTRGELREAIAPLATKAELREAIAQLATKVDLAIAPLATKAELREAIAPLATKAELELWGGALLARIQSGERLMERVLERIELSEQRLLAELARHTRASAEAMAAQISVVDEKYADLPMRTSRLEARVFRGRRR